MIKLAGYRMPRVHLPRISIGGSDHDSEHRKRDHRRGRDRHDYGDHEHGAAMAEVMDRTKHYPKTWAAHIDKPGGLMAIVEMEYKELMAEKASGSHHEIVDELTDLAAACICAIHEMKSK